jgi:hypothetical protein
MPAKGHKTGTVTKCEQCGKDVYSYPSRPARFCSKSCARTAANLTDQNPAYHRDITGENNPMHGRGLVGENNPMHGKRNHLAPRWKGGRKIRKDGYTLVVAPDEHPYPAYTKPSGLKYILEHRYAMEQHLGRYLEPQEVIHHINNNPRDNRIENLRLYSSQSEHIKDAH